jgi:hypothetical protein
MRFVWVVSPPGHIFWEVVAGAGFFGLLSGIFTLSPGLALVGFLLLLLGVRGS